MAVQSEAAAAKWDWGGTSRTRFIVWVFKAELELLPYPGKTGRWVQHADYLFRGTPRVEIQKDKSSPLEVRLNIDLEIKVKQRKKDT